MASSGSVAIRYEVKCDFVPQKTLISPSSSSSVVFTVQSILRLSVAGNPMTEFLEKKDWRERRQSSLELPWSTDEGLIIDDDHNLKISETLTLLYVPKSYHQLIIRRVPPQSVGALHLVGVAPKILVHLLEVTHLTLPLIDEQGRAICPEGRRDYAVMNYGLQTEKEEFDQAKFVDSLKKLIVVAGGIDEEEESAYIDKWFWDVIHAIKRLAWPVTKKAIVVDDEEERTCPICLEIILELHKTWRKMPCCSKAFHCDCISIWTTERVKNCPWCRSSLPLVLQSAKGLILNVDRQTCQEMSDITLCFGCQTSNERFSTLWSAQNVSIKFGSGLNEILFFLSYREVEYKLQLSHEHFWQIMLYTTGGRNDKFLVIQLFAAPLIFKRTPGCSNYSYFKEFPNDQWVRTTDFSQNLIGQSSGFCLTIPAGVTLPDFRSNLVHCLEVQSPFILEQGSPFSSNLDLVPIMYPPQGVVLPFKLLFRICALVQHGCLPGPLLNADFFHLVDPQWRDINCIEYALAKMFSLHECCYDPVQWLTQEYEKFKYSPVSTFINLENGLVYVHRALVTPIRVYFCGPEVNKSNRVLRHYIDDIDNFLRVSFVDEDWDKIQPADLSSRASGKTAIYDRMLGILRNGIVIGDKKFEFLAFSSSQLREGSIWMFASRDGLTAADIRAWMGDFKKIKNVAKYAARLGQSFGSSTETLSIPRDEIEIVPDIKIRRQGKEYNFSDGIGKISKEFSEIVAIKCGLEKFTPSAFQIRYGGFKGVVSVDPSSSKKLSLRNSMLKYESDNLKLDVLAWSKYQPCYLNRQLVTLLSTLGIKDVVFERKQSEAVAQLNAILTDPNKASEAFELMAPGGENTNIIKEMLLCGYKPDSEPFLSMTLQAFRALKLQDLRTKARIFIPSARSMMGCLDETRTLEYGEVFVQYSGTNRRLSLGGAPLFAESSNCNYIVSGYVAVAKNPCLHPGDVRVLRAVNVPALRHMVDCVVFPQKGQRPHPNECSGSDLDGDIYFVCWDQDLIPKEMKQPMDYTPAPSMELDHDVTMEEVQKYFVDYMVNDSLGRISNAHVVFADKEAQKAMSEPCLELAKLFSVAVDFPKTGVPAKMPSHLFVKEYPDFMEKPSDQKTYVSSRVIGKLYRAVKDISLDVITSFTREDAVRWYDADLEVEGFKGFIRDAVSCKTEYDFMLRILMESYGINSEAEMLCGGVIKPSKVFDHKKDPSAVHFALKALKKEARSWFMQGSQSREDSLAKASAWYHVTYHPTYWGRYNKGGETDHLISFPWCVYDKIIEIKRFKTRMR